MNWSRPPKRGEGWIQSDWKHLLKAVFNKGGSTISWITGWSRSFPWLIDSDGNCLYSQTSQTLKKRFEIGLKTILLPTTAPQKWQTGKQVWCVVNETTMDRSAGDRVDHIILWWSTSSLRLCNPATSAGCPPDSPLGRGPSGWKMWVVWKTECFVQRLRKGGRVRWTTSGVSSLIWSDFGPVKAFRCRRIRPTSGGLFFVLGSR